MTEVHTVPTRAQMFYANQLNSYEFAGMADEYADRTEFDLECFSNVYKSDWGVRPHRRYTVREVCEYYINRPSCGYNLDEPEYDFTPSAADEMEFMDSDTDLDYFDWLATFRKGRPSRAQRITEIRQ